MNNFLVVITLLIILLVIKYWNKTPPIPYSLEWIREHAEETEEDE